MYLEKINYHKNYYTEIYIEKEKKMKTVIYIIMQTTSANWTAFILIPTTVKTTQRSEKVHTF